MTDIFFLEKSSINAKLYLVMVWAILGNRFSHISVRSEVATGKTNRRRISVAQGKRESVGTSLPISPFTPVGMTDTPVSPWNHRLNVGGEYSGRQRRNMKSANLDGSPSVSPIENRQFSCGGAAVEHVFEYF